MDDLLKMDITLENIRKEFRNFLYHLRNHLESENLLVQDWVIADIEAAMKSLENDLQKIVG